MSIYIYSFSTLAFGEEIIEGRCDNFLQKNPRTLTLKGYHLSGDSNLFSNVPEGRARNNDCT